MHFAIEEPLSLTNIEKLRAQWLSIYPEQKVTEEKNVELQLDPESMRVEQTKLGHRLICKASDGTRLVQLSGRFLAVNHLKPYPGWEESFRDTIIARFRELESAIRPLPVGRVGLRYINRIDIPEVPLVWENWFNFSLPLPKIEEAALDAFQMHFEQRLPKSCRLIVNCLALAPAVPSATTVILDLDVVWQDVPVEPLLLREILERVHDPHRLAFESYITDKLRKEFS